MELPISLTTLKSNNLEEVRPPNTPRSLRACSAEGIDPNELRYLPESVFKLHELNDHPIKRPDFDQRVQVRHAAHVKSLKRDLRRVQRRFMKQRTEALRKIDVSRSNKHHIRRLATTTELEQTLDSLGIDSSNPPKWLDLDGDGDISMEELKPLETMMKRMASEKRRQERSMKIKLTKQILTIQQEEKEEKERELDQLKREKQEMFKLKRKIARENARRLKLQEDEEFKQEIVEREERKAKLMFQRQHRLREEEIKKQKKQQIKANVLLKQQIDKRHQESERRAHSRHQQELEQANRAQEKWDDIEYRRQTELTKIEQQRRKQQNQEKNRHMQKKKQMEQEEIRFQKKLQKIERDIQDRLKASEIKRQRRQAKKIKKIAENVEVHAEKKDECYKKIQQQKRQKQKRYFQKQKDDRIKKKRMHEEMKLKHESIKLKNALKYSYAHQNARRQKEAKDKRMQWVHDKMNVKRNRLERLKSQKKGIDQHAAHVRRNMTLRKEKITDIVLEATENDAWQRAERLLTNIASGGEANSPMQQHRKRKSPKRPGIKKERDEEAKNESPRKKKISIFSNPHLGDVLDSSHASELRSLKMNSTRVAAQPPHVLRMRRARKWLNLSARRFENIFGRVDERQKNLTNLYRGIHV